MTDGITPKSPWNTSRSDAQGRKLPTARERKLAEAEDRRKHASRELDKLPGAAEREKERAANKASIEEQQRDKDGKFA